MAECGYGPVDYGECSCPQDGLFAWYGAPQPFMLEPPLRGLVRRPMWYPTDDIVGAYDWSGSGTIAGQRLAYNSFSRHGWGCEAEPTVDGEIVVVGSIVGGYTIDEERVWTLEMREISSVSKPYVVLYDAVAQQQITAIDVSSLGWTESTLRTLGFALHWSGEVFNAAANEDKLFCFASGTPGGHWITFDSGGSISQEGGTPTTGFSKLAVRCWPRGARVTSTQLQIGTVAEDGEFSSTDSVTLPGNTARTLMHFDASPNDWAAVVRYTSSAGPVRERAYLNGTAISDLRLPDDPFSYNSIWGVMQMPHIAHPQEGTGIATAIFPMLEFSTSPSDLVPDGVYADDDFRYRARVYHNGSFIGQMPRTNLPRICHYSSDRWLYVVGGSGEFVDEDSAANMFAGVPFEMCRHDMTDFTGCVRFPPAVAESGSPPLTTTQYHPACEFGAAAPGGIPISHALEYYGDGGSNDRCSMKGKHDCVKNSALIGFCPPTDADDFGGVS